MARTHFQDFVRDNGLPITVEYSANGGEPDFDHPGHICDGGGSGPEVCIVQAWPNTPFHDHLARIEMSIRWPQRRALTPVGWWLAYQLSKPVAALAKLDCWWRASLTPEEDERMCAWIAERYEDDYDDSDYL